MHLYFFNITFWFFSVFFTKTKFWANKYFPKPTRCNPQLMRWLGVDLMISFAVLCCLMLTHQCWQTVSMQRGRPAWLMCVSSTAERGRAEVFEVAFSLSFWLHHYHSWWLWWQYHVATTLPYLLLFSVNLTLFQLLWILVSVPGMIQ